MPMALETEPRTRAEVLALPYDGCRHELVDGLHLVTPSPRPRHQFAQSRLIEALLPHIRAHRLGDLLASPADLTLGEDEVLQPDLFLLPPMPAIPVSWEAAPAPTLVIEIISPSSARFDRDIKRRRYQRAGVRDYWVVDPEQRQVEVWHPTAEAGEVWRERLVWPVPAEAPLVVDLEAVFS